MLLQIIRTVQKSAAVRRPEPESGVVAMPRTVAVDVAIAESVRD